MVQDIPKNPKINKWKREQIEKGKYDEDSINDDEKIDIPEEQPVIKQGQGRPRKEQAEKDKI